MNAQKTRQTLKTQARAVLRAAGYPSTSADRMRLPELRAAVEDGDMPQWVVDGLDGPTDRQRASRKAGSPSPVEVPEAEAAIQTVEAEADESIETALQDTGFRQWLQNIDADMADLATRGNPVAVEWATGHVEAWRAAQRSAMEAALAAQNEALVADAPDNGGEAFVEVVPEGCMFTAPVTLDEVAEANIRTAVGRTEKAEWATAEAAAMLDPRCGYYGPPGTGKTTAAFRLAAAMSKASGQNVRCFSVTLTEGTPSAELRGHFVPRGERFDFMLGVASLCFERGHVLVVNEPDRANSDVLTFLYGLLDDPEIATITLPTGRVLQRHPNFRCILALNEDPEVRLPEALFDRVLWTYIGAPHPGIIARLPEDLQGPCETTACHEDPQQRTTPRQWLRFAELRGRLNYAPGDTTDPNLRREMLAAKLAFRERHVEVLDAVRLARGEAAATS
jgi:hypothetical protein